MRPFKLRFSTLVAAPVLALAIAVGVLGLAAPWSPSGWLLVGVSALPSIAHFVRWSIARRALVSLSALLFVLLFVVRAGAACSGRVQMVTLPGPASSRTTSYLVDEQDVSLVGARVLLHRWRLPSDERSALLSEMRGAYLEMRENAGTTPSPMFDTALGRQRPGAFDVLVVPGANAAPEVGLVFLHGYGGNATLECWLVARAADAIGALTLCPSTGFSGHWSGPDGERTVRATVDYLKQRGIKRMYLAGLSNGAAGAATLVRRFPRSFSGLVLISGAPGSAPDPGVPTLVVHGDRDTIASAAAARAYASRNGAAYAGFDAGHFALLVKRGEVRATLSAWLRNREPERRRHPGQPE